MARSFTDIVLDASVDPMWFQDVAPEKNHSKMVQRLTDEADRLIRGLETLDSLTNAIPLVLEDSVAVANRAGKHVRVTRQGDLIEYHVAPQKIDRRNFLDREEFDFLDMFDSFAQGKGLSSDPAPYMRETKHFEPLTDFISSEQNAAEKDLFFRLRDYHLILVNPHAGTVWRARKNSFTVRITVGQDEYWEEINQILRDMHKPLIGEQRVPDDRHSLEYTGFRPEGDVYLVLNPYRKTTALTHYQIEKSPTSVVMSYYRKETPLTSVLLRDQKKFRYSPAQVNEKSGTSSFYVESTVPIDYSKDVRDELPPMWHLDHLPPYEGGVSKDEKYVYDVLGTSTYLGRRSVIASVAKREGLEVAPLSPGYGMVPVSYDTIDLRIYKARMMEIMGEYYGSVVFFDSHEEIPLSYKLKYAFSPVTVMNRPDQYLSGGLTAVYLSADVLYVPRSVTLPLWVYSDQAAFNRLKFDIMYSLHAEASLFKRAGWKSDDFFTTVVRGSSQILQRLRSLVPIAMAKAQAELTLSEKNLAQLLSLDQTLFMEDGIIKSHENERLIDTSEGSASIVQVLEAMTSGKEIEFFSEVDFRHIMSLIAFPVRHVTYDRGRVQVQTYSRRIEHAVEEFDYQDL